MSPVPSAQALYPLTNTGTSAPRVCPILKISFLGKSRFHILLSAIKTVAAFELPPPRPPPAGIFLLIPISIPAAVPLCFFKMFALCSNKSCSGEIDSLP